MADADHQEDKRLPDGPEGHPGVQVLCSAASLRLPQPEMGLVIDHRLQGFVDGDTCRFHLTAKNIYEYKTEMFSNLQPKQCN